MNKTIAEIFKPIGQAFGLKRRANLYFNSVAMENREGKLKIVPLGKFPNHPDGGHEVTMDDIKSMAEKCRTAGMDILFDYGHESLWNPKASAAGWSNAEGIEVGDDGLYIDYPELTPKAGLMVEENEYRYLSPVYKLNSSSHEAELISVALTNTPFFRTEIEHLKNSFTQLNGETKMDQKIAEFFNLPPESDENTIVEKIDSVKSSQGVTNIDELYSNAKVNSNAELLITNAINEGKILPANKELWHAWFEKDPDAAKTRLEAIKANSALPGRVNFSDDTEEDDPITEVSNFIKSQGR